MCGIAAVLAYRDSAPPVSADELLRIRDHMIARGPDGAGLWISADRRVGLAHRRLAIIDLSDAAAQPMATTDGHIHITFNGEIYNYRELRRELERRGIRFRSASDTEVLLHLYEERGAEMVHVLRGMYAFAIWDDRKKGLLLARDPFGIKPLYYADDGTTMRVASQVKALLKGGAIDTSVEPAGHVGFFLWGHVPEPYTLYKGVRALGAGTTLWIDTSGRNERRQFFSFKDEIAKASAAQRSMTAEEIRERLHAALAESVRYHLVADVPVGIFLSSGLDSSTITALARESHSADLRTITLGFKEFVGSCNDEVPLAELVATRYGTLHQTHWVTKEDFRQAQQHLLDAMDQPSTDAVNTYFVSKAAAAAGLKVALSGIGGDELFGGYDSFSQIPLAVNLFRPFHAVPWLGKGFRYVTAPILKWFTSPKYASLLEYGGSYGGAYLLRRGMFMPWELAQVLDPDIVRDGWRELQTLSRLDETTLRLKNRQLKVAAMESAWYMRNQLLRDTDWSSMVHSLEVRVPLVDVELFRAVVPMLNLAGAPRKNAMARTPSKPLPSEILKREKTGFSIPTRDWLVGQAPRLRDERGLRGWAKYLYGLNAGRGSRILALLTDAFGCHGGIGLYNRDLLTALCAHPRVSGVVGFPRNVHGRLEELPNKLTYVTDSAGGKLRYVLTVLRYATGRPRIDLVLCGHINLLPVAYICHLVSRAPILLEIYGIEAWNKTKSWPANILTSRVAAVTSISEITKEKFLTWAGRAGDQIFILPNAIHAGRYGPGPKNVSLIARYGLGGSVVLMTLGRISPDERYKGIDELLHVLPTLARTIPNVVYMVVGGGVDIGRLKDKARRLGVSDRVIFTGRISEEEKADHYRLADVYVMPSYGEGFGFVFLEALACGIPVVAGKYDGGREAVRNGEFGILVDPHNSSEIVDGIQRALRLPKRVPAGLTQFSFERFRERAHKILDTVLCNGRAVSAE